MWLFKKRTAKMIKEAIEFFDYFPRARVVIDSTNCSLGATYENYHYIVANKDYDDLVGRAEFVVKQSVRAVRFRAIQDMGLQTFFDLEANECFKKNIDNYLDFNQDKNVADAQIVGEVSAMLYLENYPIEEIKKIILMDASEIRQKYMG